MLIAFVIVYSAVAVVVRDACRYPDFVQSGDWRGHLSSHVTYSVTFDGRLMRVVASNTSFQRRCMLKVGNRMYLAAQSDLIVSSDRAPRNRYVCMEFVRRDEAVLQLRTSRLASRMDPHLCSEHQLTLDDRPLVDRRRSSVGSDCRLTGGYDVRLYDRRRRRGVCDALDAKTRLEANCSDDCSLHFRFRYSFCVPSGLGMRSDQVTRCAATWTADGYVFSVLVASSPDVEDRLNAWCLRRPRWTRGRPFTAFLFHQLVCDSRPVAQLVDALMVDMQPSEDWGSSLCVDDYEGCEYGHYPAVCARTADCARTCSICNDSVPTDCLFSFPLYGRWRSADGETLVTVNGSSLTVTAVDESGRGRWTRYDCVEWSRVSSSSNMSSYADHTAEERLVVTRPGSGCRPRYACVQLQYNADTEDRSPSVVYFRMSASQPWPIYGDVGCSALVAQLSTPDEIDQHFTLMTTDAVNGRRNYVDCVAASLPVDRRFIVEFSGKTHQLCVARIKAAPNSHNVSGYVQLTMTDCGKDSATLDVRCLDRVTLNGEGAAVLLVTELSPSFPGFDADSVLFCWLFANSDMFYLLSSSDCDPPTSLERLQRRLLRPVAVFVDALSITTTTTAAATTTVSSSLTIASSEEVTVYGSNDDSLAFYDSAMPPNNGTSHKPISATATAGSRQQWDGISLSQTTSTTPRQTSIHVDVESGRHNGKSSFAHVTSGATSAPAATAAVIAVDMSVFVVARLHTANYSRR